MLRPVESSTSALCGENVTSLWYVVQCLVNSEADIAYQPKRVDHVELTGNLYERGLAERDLTVEGKIQCLGMS